MKISSVTFLMAIALASGMPLTPVLAADHDAAIKQCVVDNKDEKQLPEVLTSYCTCMTGKMGDTEKASVTEWEGSHKDAMDTCATSSNWKLE